ncbi:241_t:CDS:2 [Paraglomus occultum]|uniref:241_t:CDS:1 n=1 Tax=Paraglomus occultum TaxID=144539 RepID=A0A9N9FXC9_9GLOM|nr:241_t:CDS:2 [Paraglomus occultum]
MAPNTGDSNVNDGQPTQLLDGTAGQEQEREEGIWSSILDSVSSTKAIPTKNAIILGDKESGKSTLISYLKGEDDFETSDRNNSLNKAEDGLPRGDYQNNDLALSYTFVDIDDEETEEDDTIARLGFYQLASSDKAYNSLLRFALNLTTLQESVIIIVLDWSRPWTFIETLQRWIKVVEQAINSVKQEGDSGSKTGWTKGKVLVEEMAELLEKFIQSYTDSETSAPNSNVLEPESEVALPMGPGTLTTNLGIPLIVVCAKSDNISNLEQDSKFKFKEEQLEFIQQNLRTVCLKYGAALFYTSTRHPETIGNLRKYILYRLLGAKASSSTNKSAFAFNLKTDVVNKERVMIPTGWDSWAKIKISREFDCKGVSEGWDDDMEPRDSNQTEDSSVSAKKIYAEVIYQEDDDNPLSEQVMIVAEDEQDFFKGYYDSISKQNGDKVQMAPSVVGPMGAAAYTAAYTNIGGIDEEKWAKFGIGKDQSKSSTSNVPAVNGEAPNGPVNGVGTSTQPPSQNEVLANFFQGLLEKRAGTSRSPQPPANGSTANLASGNPKLSTVAMVQVELEKMKATAGTVGK